MELPLHVRGLVNSTTAGLGICKMFHISHIEVTLLFISICCKASEASEFNKPK